MTEEIKKKKQVTSAKFVFESIIWMENFCVFFPRLDWEKFRMKSNSFNKKIEFYFKECNGNMKHLKTS